MYLLYFLAVRVFRAVCGLPWLRWVGASLVSAHWSGLCISSSQAELPCGMWNLPRPEMEPMSPALAGGLNLWTIRKSQQVLFSSHFSNQQPEDVFFFNFTILYWFCHISWASWCLLLPKSLSQLHPLPFSLLSLPLLLFPLLTYLPPPWSAHCPSNAPGHSCFGPSELNRRWTLLPPMSTRLPSSAT